MILLLLCLNVSQSFAEEKENDDTKAKMNEELEEVVITGLPAPLFSIVDMRGETFNLDTLRGQKAVLIIFWATFSFPSLEDLVACEKFYQKYKEQVEVIGISVDSDEKAVLAEKKATELGITFRIAMDDENEIKSYNRKRIPYLILINKEGLIIQLLEGSSGTEKTLQKLEELLLTEPEYQTYINNPKDGTNLILVSAGEFIFGESTVKYNKDYTAGIAYYYKYNLNLPRYYIAEYCVTNAQYKKFVDATGHRAPTNSVDPQYNIWTGNTHPPELADHPVVNISWEDAKAYCDWAGLRLPTELEWEKAARGTQGRNYPWGNEWDENKCRHQGNKDNEMTCSVWAYPAGRSPYGCYNMAGNVYEWCADWYDKDAFIKPRRRNQPPPASGQARVIRGGAWFYAHTSLINHDFFRCANRNANLPSKRSNHIGFRCAKDAK